MSLSVSESAWAEICQSELFVQVDPTTLCTKAKPSSSSPIDEFYAYSTELVRLGEPRLVQDHPMLARLILLGLLSGVESYLRGVITGLVRVCPVARRLALAQSVHLGTLEYYGHQEFGRALLDGVSLAGKKEVRSQLRRLTGLEVPSKHSLSAALEEFDKVCHFRHATIHARGIVGGQNLAALGLGSDESVWTVSLDFKGLQDCILVCHSFVRGINRWLYRETVERWIGQALLQGSWAIDKERFSSLFSLFYSRNDASCANNAYQTWQKIRRVLVAR